MIYLTFVLQQVHSQPFTTAEVILIHKKDSKLDIKIYCLISLLLNLDKILENLIHSRLITFLNIKDIIP